MTKEVQRYADAAMFRAAPMRADRDDQGNIVPVAHVISMNPDPLGALAAACKMYKGEVVYNLAEVTDDERRLYWGEVQKTHLKAPLEFIKIHLLVEGVTRSFTHQMVRQRTAVYAQESMRFAVTEDMAARVSVPPSVANGSVRVKDLFVEAISNIETVYNALIAEGVPAEDARALMPHAVTTRLHWATDFRNFTEHAGNRLCTQAQFEWRAVWNSILEAIAGYATNPSVLPENEWQFQYIADSTLFRPICYKTGKCEFMANLDRHCSIRERVNNLYDVGVGSNLWDARTSSDESRKGLPGIFPGEWLADPTAAREGSAGHD